MLILAGGSNVVIGDAGFPGDVVLLRTRGVGSSSADAGSSWCGSRPASRGTASWPVPVADGWSGVECLSGIPGSAGATPIQNVGAYGQEVAQTIVAVHVYDRVADRGRDDDAGGVRVRVPVQRLQAQRPVAGPRGRLPAAALAESAPIRYAELARQLGVEVGDRVPLAQARDTVLKLRAGKGMVLDADDQDTWSVGSFFTNPVLPGVAPAAAATRCRHWPAEDGRGQDPGGLADRAGRVPQGLHPRGGVAISSKHTLALTNRGDGTTAALLDLAREIRDGVRDAVRHRRCTPSRSWSTARSDALCRLEGCRAALHPSEATCPRVGQAWKRLRRTNIVAQSAKIAPTASAHRR